MCLICVEYQAGRMNSGEVIRAIKEMKAAKTDPEHVQELIDLLTERINKAADITRSQQRRLKVQLDE